MGDFVTSTKQQYLNEVTLLEGLLENVYADGKERRRVILAIQTILTGMKYYMKCWK